MIGAHHSQQGSRRWLSAVLRWIAGLGVLGVLLYFLPFATVRKAIAQVPAWLFLGTLVGYLLAHTLGIAKWRMVVNAAGAELDFATSAQCYLGGLFGTLELGFAVAIGKVLGTQLDSLAVDVDVVDPRSGRDRHLAYDALAGTDHQYVPHLVGQQRCRHH